MLEAKLHSPKRFQILSCSGGGFFGLYTATILAQLEENRGIPIARSFELLAGTSVGGIIALALAAEIPAEQVKRAMETVGPRVFSDRPVPQGIARWADLSRNALGPKYSDTALREAVLAVFKGHADMLIGDLLHPVIVPAVNLAKGKPQVFKTPHHPTFVTDLHLKVIDVALATSAAPTFFPIAEVNDQLYADGGLFANSPDLLALHEAEHFFEANVADVWMLSIGTTTSQFSFSHELGRHLGIVAWLEEQRLINVMIAAQQQSVDYMVSHRLRDRYLRIDALQSKEQERHLALDVATVNAQRTIRGLAQSSFQSYVNNHSLKNMLSWTSAMPKFSR